MAIIIQQRCHDYAKPNYTSIRISRHVSVPMDSFIRRMVRVGIRLFRQSPL